MKRALPLLALALASAGEAHPKRPAVQFGEPGDIISAEGNFVHIAAAKGTKAAIQATAERDAVIFAPQPTNADAWAERATPAELATRWHTTELWMSCDGSFAVTHGEWQRGDARGWYATVWHREKGGDYQWVLAESGPLATPLPASDMIGASVADCPAHQHGAAPAPVKAPQTGPVDYTSHRADDDTMAWTTATEPGGGYRLSVRLKQNGQMKEVLNAVSAAR